MPAWSGKTGRAPSRHCREAGVHGHTTTAIHDIEGTSPHSTKRQWRHSWCNVGSRTAVYYDIDHELTRIVDWSIGKHFTHRMCRRSPPRDSCRLEEGQVSDMCESDRAPQCGAVNWARYITCFPGWINTTEYAYPKQKLRTVTSVLIM